MAGIHAQGQMVQDVNIRNQPAVINKKENQRKWMVGTASVVGYGTSMILFSQAWYKDFPKSSFHTFNDGGEWLQMDKTGHGWAAYNTSRLTTDMWQWAGVKPSTSIVIGTGSSLLYLLSVEYLDGHSAEWGWSWPDVIADLSGAALFASQEFGWKQQKIQLKFSSHYQHYPEPDLQQRANDLFGSTWPERILKDYNAQSYWLSFNLKKLIPESRLPRWLSISIGYGAGGMFGGYENVAHDKNGMIIFDRSDIQRYRQWYLAPDIDFTQIRSKSGFLRTVFSVINVLKFPTPALELSQGKLKVKPVVF
jgi:uncharacterized protein YfiM (DUF2279 family)